MNSCQISNRLFRRYLVQPSAPPKNMLIMRRTAVFIISPQIKNHNLTDSRGIALSWLQD